MTISECFECAGQAEQQHHVVPRSKGGTKTVWLCVECHGKVHGRKMAHNELTKNTMAEKKKRGELVGGVPYGFSAVEGVLIKNEEEQRAIEIARRLRAHGFTYRVIGDALWNMGYANKVGAEFNHATIWKICGGMKRAGKINKGDICDYL